MGKPEIVKDISYSNNLRAHDHVSILINLACSPETNYFNLARRNYHNGNYEEIRSDLSSVEWKQINKDYVSE